MGMRAAVAASVLFWSSGCLMNNPSWDEGDAVADTDGGTSDGTTTDGATTLSTSTTSTTTTSTSDDDPGSSTSSDAARDTTDDDPGPDGDPLVLSLSLDEGAGGVANDASEQGYQCFLRGEPSWVSGVYEQAVQFSLDGGDDWGECNGDERLQFANRGSYTVALWANPAQAPEGSSAGAEYALLARPGMATGLFYDSESRYLLRDVDSNGQLTVVTSVSPLGAARWHHIAATVDREAGIVAFFVDGQLFNQLEIAPGGTGMDYGTSPWYLGIANPETGDSQALDGSVDEVRIYDHVMPAADIAALALWPE